MLSSLPRPARRRLPRCLLWLALGASAALHAADPRPVSIQDLCLMLRSGYSDAEVLQETAARPLLEPLTPAAEQTLRAAGADQRLVDALKTGRRAVSPAEALAARQQQALQEQRAAASAVQQAALLRSQQAAAPAAPGSAAGATPPAGDPHGLENLLRGKLVMFRDEKIVEAPGDALEGKKVLALYYARLASKAGGTFAADLVEFYRKTVPKHPEFEIVFMSGDPSLYSMENFMRHVRMPWLALGFDQLAQVQVLSRLQDPSGAQRLLVADNFGHPLADYHIGSDPGILPQILPDLAKVIADPTHPSALAPPPSARPPGPAVGQTR